MEANTHTHTHNGNYAEVVGILISLIVVIFSESIHTAKHQVVHLKYIWFLYIKDNEALIKPPELGTTTDELIVSGFGNPWWEVLKNSLPAGLAAALLLTRASGSTLIHAEFTGLLLMGKVSLIFKFLGWGRRLTGELDELKGNRPGIGRLARNLCSCPGSRL